MNFLAHIYLSQGHPKVTIGNFIGDFVKGTQIDRYDDEIRKGILLHRAIDHFTDTHEIVKKSKDRLRGNFRHYAPVIVDVFYDHILAREWKKYAQEDLNDFVRLLPIGNGILRRNPSIGTAHAHLHETRQLALQLSVH